MKCLFELEKFSKIHDRIQNILIIFVSIIPECKKVIMADPWFSSSFSVATISILDLALSDSGFDAIEEPISMHFDLIEIGCPNLCLPKNFLEANEKSGILPSWRKIISVFSEFSISLMLFIRFGRIFRLVWAVGIFSLSGNMWRASRYWRNDLFHGSDFIS